MNKKGFILLDAVLSLFIVTFITTVTINVYQNYKGQKDSYDTYQSEIADRYLEIYEELGECEKCVIEDESEDSSLSEPF